MPKVVASIEARMTSTRLPGKVLADVAGRPALTRLLARLRRCTTLDDIVLATTVNPADDVLVDWAQREGVAVFRGSEDDVLGRVVAAQHSRQGEIVVEICGDCILTDPQIVDLGVTTFLAHDCALVSNNFEPGYPQGIAVDVARLTDLEAVARTVEDPVAHEHVLLYLFEHPEQYPAIHLQPPAVWRDPELRTQLDYPEDLRFIDAVYQRLEPRHGDDFGIRELLALVAREPALREINRQGAGKAVR